MATISTSVIERARYLSLLWQKAEDANLQLSVMPASILVALTLEPVKELSWFSLPMTKALLISGKTSLAKKWFNLSLGTGSVGFEETRNFYNLMMILSILGEDFEEPYDKKYITKIWSGISTSQINENKNNSNSKLLAIMSASGYDVDKGTWLNLLKNESLSTMEYIPSISLLYQLKEASKYNRIAEVVTISAILLQSGGGPKELNTLALTEVIQALNMVGLNKEAEKIIIHSSMEVAN